MWILASRSKTTGSRRSRNRASHPTGGQIHRLNDLSNQRSRARTRVVPRFGVPMNPKVRVATVRQTDREPAPRPGSPRSAALRGVEGGGDMTAQHGAAGGVLGTRGSDPSPPGTGALL